jgi:exopolysaccharide biosynthesis WecB/TagA/CpsF family protein
MLQIVYPEIETVELGRLPVTRLDRRQTAELMLSLVRDYRRAGRPWIATSVNGQVISHAADDEGLREALLFADLVSCDGQPLVAASGPMTGAALPERVATTDLFHDVAEAARGRSIGMFFLGASEEENRRAVETVRQLYPHVQIAGRLHGFRGHAEWIERLDEINALAPDILWVALGVPREQHFYMRFAHALPQVGLIKTSGGLFNFLSGSARRAPAWMQRSGLEWAFRTVAEPRRLAMRYLTTNPRAALLLLLHSKRGVRRARLRSR